MRVLDASTRSFLRKKIEVCPDGIVVLERLPRGGGATNWYWCRGLDELDWVLESLQPASAVSFYFDNRLPRRSVGEELLAIAEQVFDRDPDLCFGRLASDGVTIEMDFVGPSELFEAMALSGADSRPFVGAFPSQDDDGLRAVSAIVPDADGAVRTEPH